MDAIVLFTLGSQPVYAAPLLLWAGILACLAIACRQMRSLGYPTRSLALFALLAIILGFVLAHLGYGLVRLDYTLHDAQPLSLLAVWDGHYLLYGGMAGCALAVVLVAKGANRSALSLLDTLAPIGALMIAVCRLAQGLLGEGYGAYLDDGSAFARFPFAVYDAYYEAWAWALFLLAALVAVLLSVWLAIHKSRFAGDKALLLVGLYASAQIVLESLRRDNYLRWGFVRSSQVISAVLVVAVLVCYALPRHGQPLWRKAISFTVFVAMASLCTLLEFALEQRVDFMQSLSTQACYGWMAAACIVLIGAIGLIRGKPAIAGDNAQPSHSNSHGTLLRKRGQSANEPD